MSNHLTVVESDTVVVSMQRAYSALAEAVTISQTKKILDVAAAAEIYARRQHLSEEAEQLAATVKVEALRKLGEMLRATERAPSAKGTGSNQHAKKEVELPTVTPPTLSELGLTKRESAVAQKLAALPEEAFQQVRDGHITVTKAIAAVDAARKPAPAAEPETPEPEGGLDAMGQPLANWIKVEPPPPPDVPMPPPEGFGPSDEELAEAEKDAADERARLRLMLDSDAPLAAANDRIKQLQAEVTLLKARIVGLTNECATATRLAKSWRMKVERMERV